MLKPDYFGFNILSFLSLYLSGEIMTKKHNCFFLAMILLLLVCTAILSVAIGARNIPLTEMIKTICGEETDPIYLPIIQKRIVRTVLGLIAGCALGTAGCLMQSITRNPIADPSILGVNTGASLFVVTGIAFWNISSPQQYIVFALCGAFCTTLLVFGLTSFVPGQGAVSSKSADPIRLALSGAAVSTACGSLISTIMLPRTNVMQVFRFWQTGSIGGGSWEEIRMVLPFLIVGLILAVVLIPSLNVLALGDDIAVGLGVNVVKSRGLGILAAVLLCGATTAVAGPIGFVGLMVPHLVGMVMGKDLHWQLPCSALGGAVLLLLADVAGRWIGRPGETEVGIVTAFIGAPVFIFIVGKAKVGK